MKQTAVEFLKMMYEKNNNLSKLDFLIAKGMEKEQQGYSKEEIMNALHSVEFKYNRDFTKIYEDLLEYLKQFKNK
jgi:hypothetical protein